MKKFLHFFSTSVVLCIIIFLFSCKKSITPSTNEEAALNDAVSSTAYSSNPNCKPVVLGALFTTPLNNSFWQTFMQKWYDGSGKVSNLKVNLPFLSTINSDIFMEVPWGEVLYLGNEIHFRNVLKNTTILRVILDVNGKPSISYFFDDRGANKISFADTSHYYFTGNRLDSIKSTYDFKPGNNPISLKYVFSYDVFGNMVKMSTGDQFSAFRMVFEYDYLKPANGMVGIHQRNLAWTLLGYLEVMELPIHHAVKNVIYGAFNPGSSTPHEIFPVIIWTYGDQVIDNGLVHSYKLTNEFFKNTFYTGWECTASPAADPSNRQNNEINSLQDFKKQYPSK